MMHVGDIMIHVGGHRKYTRGCSVHQGFQYKSKAFINLLPHMNRDVLPLYSWYPSNVLNTPQCTHDISHMNHDIPPMY